MITENMRDVMTIFIECTFGLLFGCVIVLVDVHSMDKSFFMYSALILVPISIVSRILIWKGFDRKF